MNENEIFCLKTENTHRSYTFEVLKDENDHLFLKVSEQENKDDVQHHHTIKIFEADLRDFSNSLKQVVKTINKIRKIKAYSVEEVRKKHQKAYFPWTKEEDNKLELLFCEGISIRELSEMFKRNKGAIDSRIKKLELRDKYPKR